MKKWKKRVCACCMVAVLLVLCCSCGMVRELNSMISRRDDVPVPTREPRKEEVPSLPSLPREEEAVPSEQMSEAKTDPEDFARLVDTESLLAGDGAMTLLEADADIAYSMQADGTYLKETPFMGKDGGVILSFGSNGKNDFVNYFYSGELKNITAPMIVKEFTALLEATERKYGNSNIHMWSLSPTGSTADMSMVGEFAQEDMIDAIVRNRTAGFQYAWRRVGDTIVYITLFLDGQGNYAVDFVYDSTQTSNRPAYGI